MKSQNIEYGKYYYWMNGGVLELVRRMDGYFVKRDGTVADVRTEDQICPVSGTWYKRHIKE